MLGQVQTTRNLIFFCRASIKISPPFGHRNGAISGKKLWERFLAKLHPVGWVSSTSIVSPFLYSYRGWPLSVRNLRWRLLMLWKAVVFVAVLVFILVHMIVFAKSETRRYISSDRYISNRCEVFDPPNSSEWTCTPVKCPASLLWCFLPNMSYFCLHTATISGEVSSKKC